MLAEQEKREKRRVGGGNENARLSFTRAETERERGRGGAERVKRGNKNGRVNEKREKSRAARRISKRTTTVH